MVWAGECGGTAVPVLALDKVPAKREGVGGMDAGGVGGT